jgi:hypothetical protein
MKEMFKNRCAEISNRKLLNQNSYTTLLAANIKSLRSQ